MKHSKEYQEHEVVVQLNKKHDIQINPNSIQIQILKGSGAKNDVGIKSKGKIDFLTNYRGYHVSSVTKFTK